MFNHIWIQLGCKDKKKKKHVSFKCHRLTPGPNLAHPVFIWPQAMLVFHIFNWKKSKEEYFKTSVQLLSHVWLFATTNHSTPGLLGHHQLPESTQTRVHWVSDAIQQSHPLSSPSPPALNLSQNQGLFQ